MKTLPQQLNSTRQHLKPNFVPNITPYTFEVLPRPLAIKEWLKFIRTQLSNHLTHENKEEFQRNKQRRLPDHVTSFRNYTLKTKRLMRCKTGAHTQTRTPCIQCAIASLLVYEIMKLEGAVAVVTGGARGIGKAITKSLLQNKAKVELEYTYFKTVYCRMSEPCLHSMSIYNRNTTLHFINRLKDRSCQGFKR